jgi:hypothetical protein
MRAAHELLGVPTIGGGSARPEGGGGGSQRSQISLPNCPECTQKWRQNSWFPAIIDLKIAENVVFYLKVLNKIYSQDFFEEYINFKFFVT